MPADRDGAIVALSCDVHAYTWSVRCAKRSFLSIQAPLLVDFRDNSNEAEIKMTLQFASTAKAQVCTEASTTSALLWSLCVSRRSQMSCPSMSLKLQAPCGCRRWWQQARITG